MNPDANQFGRFGVIAEVIDERHYVVLSGPIRVEAMHYRGEVFTVPNRVFIEKLGPGAVWIIASGAGNEGTGAGSPGDSGPTMFPPNATAAVTLPSLIAGAVGATETAGASAGMLPNLIAAAVGLVTTNASGTAATVLPNLTALATGLMQPEGAGAPVLPNLAANAVGMQRISATAAASLQNLSASATGIAVEGISGTAEAILQNLVAASTGVMQPSGTAAASLQSLVASATGAQAGAEEFTGRLGIEDSQLGNIVPGVDSL